MESSRSLIILSSITIYMLFCFFIGIWAMKKTKSTKDFFAAGRNIGIIVTAFAVFSSSLSGFGFVGGPGLIYRMGMSSVWMIVCCGIGFAVSYFLNGKQLRMYAEYYDAITLPDLVAQRYNSNTTSLLVAIAILLGVFGYLATQVLAMATVLNSILISSANIDLGITTCLVIAASTLIFYCVTGGIIASVYTDVVQGFVMVVASVLVFITALLIFDGGPSEMIAIIASDDSESVQPWGTYGIMGSISWFLLFGLGGAGQPHIISKFMMSRKIEDAKRSLPLVFITFSLAALLWISIGLVMRALVISGGHTELVSPDNAAPQFLQHYAHPLLAGIVFAGLFAAIMSTADSFLNLGAAVLTHDLPKALLGIKPRNELLVARIATVTVGIISTLTAYYAHYMNREIVGLLGAFGWATFAAALVPVVAIGFNWSKANATAANAAIVCSLVFNFSSKLLGYKAPYGIDNGAIAMVMSCFVFFALCNLIETPDPNPELKAIMKVL